MIRHQEPGLLRTEALVGIGTEQLLCVTDQPAGEALGLVVICHGLTGDRVGHQRLLTVLAEQLASCRLLCVRFDFRGSGDSSGRFVDTTFARMAADLEHVARWARVNHDLEDVVLVGLSIGGVIPAMLARTLRARAVALLSSDLVEDVRFQTETHRLPGTTLVPVRAGEFHLPEAFWRERETLHPFSDLKGACIPVKLFCGEHDEDLAAAASRFTDAGFEVESIVGVDHLFESYAARRHLGRRIGAFFLSSLRNQPHANLPTD